MDRATAGVHASGDIKLRRTCDDPHSPEDGNYFLERYAGVAQSLGTSDGEATQQTGQKVLGSFAFSKRKPTLGSGGNAAKSHSYDGATGRLSCICSSLRLELPALS
jgi:hypothetical protein